jgi:hypothetical protein
VLHIVSLEGRGDLAYVHGTFEQVFAAQAGAAPVTEIRRRGGGGWTEGAIEHSEVIL